MKLIIKLNITRDNSAKQPSEAPNQLKKQSTLKELLSKISKNNSKKLDFYF